MSDISVIGLGAMGSALVRTLLLAGYTVTVWNRSADKAAALVDAGAVLADNVQQALDASPATITCIKSHEQTIELMRSCAGTLGGKTVIELSTGGSTEAVQPITRTARLGAIRAPIRSNNSASETGAMWAVGSCVRLR